MTRSMLAVLAAFAGGALQAQAPSAGTILARVAALYGNARSYHFAAIKTGEEKGSLEIWVQHPDRFRFEGDGRVIDGSDAFPHVTFVGNGNVAWNYMAGPKQYATASTTMPLLDTEPPEITPDVFVFQADAVFLSHYARLAAATASAKLLREEKITSGAQSVDCYVIQLHAPLPAFRDDYTWWVDKKRFLILREDTQPASARRAQSRVEFTTASIDDPLSEDIFRFIPPADAKHVDHLASQ